MDPNEDYSALPDSAFLLPAVRALPIHTRPHWLAARQAIVAMRTSGPRVGFRLPDAPLSEPEQNLLLRAWVDAGVARGYLDEDSLAHALCDGRAVLMTQDGAPMAVADALGEFFAAALDGRPPAVYHHPAPDLPLAGWTVAQPVEVFTERIAVVADERHRQTGAPLDGLMARAAQENFRYWFPEAYRRAFPAEAPAAIVDAIQRVLEADAAAGADTLITDAIVPEKYTVIQDATADKPLRVRILLSRANVLNGNSRVYPFEVLTDMVERAQAYLPGRVVTMEWLHPPTIVDDDGCAVGFAVDPRRDVAVIDAVFMDRDAVMIDVAFMATPFGDAIAAQIRAGKRPPVSLRALGRLQPSWLAGIPVEIATRLTWYGGDFVPNPALPEAGPVQVLTDSQIYEALLISAKEEHPMDRIQQMQAQLDALTASGRPEDRAEITRLTQAIADAQTTQATADQTLATTQQQLAAAQAQLATVTAQAGNTTALQATVDGLAQTVTQLSGQVQNVLQTNQEAAAAAAREQARTRVQAIADAARTRAEVLVFPPEVQTIIVDRVGRCETPEAAEQALLDNVADFNTSMAVARAAAVGLGIGGGTSGTPGAGGQGRPTHVQVTENPKPWQPIIDSMTAAMTDHARRTNTRLPVDESIMKANRVAADQMVSEIMEVEGAAIIDSCQAITDSLAKGEPMRLVRYNGPLAITDAAATNQSHLFNQPMLLLACLYQQFQMLEMLQFCHGIGPKGFTQSVQGRTAMGAVLRLPVQYFETPTGAEDLPYFDDGMIVGENGAIPEIGVRTNWLEFSPIWRRAAFSISAEAEAAMLNGPLNMDVFATHMQQMILYKARKIDQALSGEMLLTADEYGAVAVASEAVAADEWVYDNGGSAVWNGITYGSNVHSVAQLLCGGTTGDPNLDVPLVRPRTSQSLNASGELQSVVTANGVSVAAVDSVVQVQGYLNGDRQITGTGATYAVDWEHGVVCFKAVGTSGADATNRPTITYTYATNYDEFQLTGVTYPAGTTQEDYLNRLLRQIGGTAAGMGSYPRLAPPNLGIMSLAIAHILQGASNFENWRSRGDRQLLEPRVRSSSKFAEIDGIELAKINAPWPARDARIFLGQVGATKYAVEKPFEIQGPMQLYNPATGKPIDARGGYGREKSVICTPQVEKQDGTILNPVSRTIRLK